MRATRPAETVRGAPRSCRWPCEAHVHVHPWAMADRADGPEALSLRLPVGPGRPWVTAYDCFWLLFRRHLSPPVRGMNLSFSPQLSLRLWADLLQVSHRRECPPAENGQMHSHNWWVPCLCTEPWVLAHRRPLSLDCSLGDGSAVFKPTFQERP